MAANVCKWLVFTTIPDTFEMSVNGCKCLQMFANPCKSDVNVCKCLQMFANGCKCLQMSVMVTRRACPGFRRLRERIPGVAAGAHCAVPLHMQSAGENKCKWLCKYQQSRANVCKCLQMFAGCLQMFVSVCQ